MIRIAMWSGPRNLSTAMMRSFGARADTACIDEPFYAAFLQLTGTDHPMRAEILAAHETDATKVARDLATGHRDAEIFYQKHMTHHMVDGIDRDWMGSVRHAFLIRHPARVLRSYAKKREQVSLADIGFVQQAELFTTARELTGSVPVVIDADDVLRAPALALPALCRALGIDEDPAMLNWPPGPRSEDGAWAPHWYDGVWASTGFGPPPGPLPDLPDHLARISDDAMPSYAALREVAIEVPYAAS